MAGQTEQLAKATFNAPSSMTTGLQPYNLEMAAKNLVPYLSPLRNSIPRVNQDGGSGPNWRGVVATSAGNYPMGVAEGQRGGSISVTTKEYFANFRTIGLEGSVTWEAQLSGEGFDDLRARAVTTLLSQCMQEEEKIILGGNSSLALGTTPAPSLTAATTGGTIGASITVSVICVALTYEGRKLVDATNGPSATFTRTNTDGTTVTIGGGVAQKSTNTTIAVSAGSTNSVVCKLTSPVRGAYGYAWYVGNNASPGTERFAGVTDRAFFTATVIPSTSNLASALPAADNSKNGYIHDGLLSMIGDPANGSYWNAMANGSTLTADGNGGCVEIDAALQSFWDNQRLSPSRILYGSSEAAAMKRIVMSGPGSGSSNGRFTFNVAQGSLTGGGIVRGYLNPFGMGNDNGNEIKLQQHPFMPPGTILFLTDSLPYAMNNITNIMQVKTRSDYYQLEWPLRTRMYEYAVYSDQVFQHYFPPSMGVITNITQG